MRTREEILRSLGEQAVEAMEAESKARGYEGIFFAQNCNIIALLTEQVNLLLDIRDLLMKDEVTGGPIDFSEVTSSLTPQEGEG